MVPLRVWKNSTFPMRSLALSALGLWTWQALVLARQFTVAFGRISVIIFALLAPEPSAHGNLDTTSASLIGWSLSRNACFDSGFMFLVFSRWLWTNFWYFFVKGSSDPAVDSRLALVDNGVFTHLAQVPPAGHRVLLHGEVCTVDASTAWIARVQAGHYFCEPLVSDRHVSLFQYCMRRVFPVFHTGWGVTAQALAHVN